MSANDKSKDKDHAQPWSDSSYRQYVIETLYEYVTQNKTLDPVEAYREVMTVTGRTYGTVKNWLYYRTNLPDLESLARMVQHWRIPAEALFPPNVRLLLGESAADNRRGDEAGSVPFLIKDQLLLSLYGTPNPANVDRALVKYTDNPKSTVLMRQQSAEMQGEIRPGELMLVDASVEHVEGSGMYLLRFTTDGSQSTCVRIVEVLPGQQTVKLSCANPLMSGSNETVVLREGLLPEHITVLGRVVGVMKQI